MRGFVVLLPVMALAQAPPPKPVVPAKPPVAKPAAARPAAKKAVAAKPTAAAKPAAQKPAALPALASDEEKTLYALGLSIHRSLAPFDLSPAEVEIVKRALSDAAGGKPALDLNEWGPKIQPLASQRAARVTEREKEVSKAYLEKAAAAPGAVKTESGLIYRELTAGTGASPKPTDKVKVHYRGTLANGTEFDSSYKRNMPAEFALNGVIKCWTEGLQKMKAGGKAILVCPASLAYGDQGRPTIPGGAALTFEVELLDIPGATP